jgi:hypothetical protein
MIEFNPSIILLYLSFPYSWNSFNRSHFPFSYMSTEYFHHIHLPYPVLIAYPLSLVPNPRQDLFYFLILHFWKKTCLYKIAMQGVLLWHFHVCMYYYLNWFIPSIFLLSSLVSPSYGDFKRLKILYSFLHMKYINHVHLLNLLVLSPLSH